jgi:pimeloyl-ACP methyl ester carboxylesterase
MSHRILHAVVALLLSSALLGCVAWGDIAQPIPSALVAAPRDATRLVIVLPGRSDDLQALQGSGIAEAVQSAWPDADVVLAGLTLAYYEHGDAPQRLHEQIIAPARQRGYREIWLAGASMGGAGTLLYDATYPGEVDGIVLLAPYVGDVELLDEIMAEGGIARWNPGPKQAISAATWQRELWRHVQSWVREPEKARNVWLTYGDRDRLARAMPILEPALRPEQVFVRRGGHTWSVWSPAMHDVLTRAGASASGASGASGAR